MICTDKEILKETAYEFQVYLKQEFNLDFSEHLIKEDSLLFFDNNDDCMELVLTEKTIESNGLSRYFYHLYTQKKRDKILGKLI